MRIPAVPPPYGKLLETLRTPERAGKILSIGGPDVDGRYFHWKSLRRRQPPLDLSHEEWWLTLKVARYAMRTFFNLNDEAGQRFWFAATDSVQRSLHRIDRDVGADLEFLNPLLAHSDSREMYIIRSLAEEAITSSQLEGASTTRKVAKEMLLSGRAPRSPDEWMIANNFSAMQFAREHAKKPLTLELLLTLHLILTENTLKPDEVGRLRRPEEEVVVEDLGTGQVLHTPPAASALPKRLSALFAFANESKTTPFIHPIVRSIMLHFMLAYEHPFVDGNGRTARALFYWSMLRHGYGLAEFLSISRTIKKAPAQYRNAFLLTETDEADVTYFILHQLEVVLAAITDLQAYLKRKDTELRKADELLKESGHLNHRQIAVINEAVRHPTMRFTIEAHRTQFRIVYQTARTDLLGLVDGGWLRKRQSGRRFDFEPSPNLEQKLKRP